MANTYYAYQDVKRKIAHKLMTMDGWNVYGYHADNSDLMTDYYDPAYWGGIATKNGYTLVIDRTDAAEESRREYYVNGDNSAEIAEKVAKLERMTQANGASAQEEQTARAAIEKLQEKQTAGREKRINYTPGHLANPPRCNWHIEKDGIILDKGSGLLKFANVPDITLEREQREWQNFNTQTPEEWKKHYVIDCVRRWNDNPEEATRRAESAYNEAVEAYALLDKFNALIARFNTICGGMVGNSGESGYRFDTRKVTKYKKVWKFNPTESGSFVPGQCFRLKANFTHGGYSGAVYRFSAAFDGQCVRGERVSMKSGKSLTGTANASNSFGYYAADGATENRGRDREKFLHWIETGAIEWGEVVEVSEPYEVEKMVKVDANGNEYKPQRAEKAAEKATEPSTTDTTNEEPKTGTSYTITADTDTRDGSQIWVVTLADRVSREEFDAIREQMKSAGGYYSRFKKGFLFRFDPSDVLNGSTDQSDQEQTEEQTEEQTHEQPEEQTQEQPTEEQTTKAAKTAYGYTGETSQEFTAEELRQLLNGSQVLHGDGYRRAVYFATHNRGGAWFVYSLHLGESDTVSPRTGADFCGFVIDGAYFVNFSEIRESLKEDINTELLQMIPTEAAAELNAAELDDTQIDTIIRLRAADFEREAIKLYLDEKSPELVLYSASDRTISDADLVRYILTPSEVVKDYAESVKRSHRFDILCKFITANRTSAALERIKANKAHRAHVLKAINSALAGDLSKSYRVTISNGATIKADADAVRRVPRCGYLSEWYIKSGDRQHLERDERGRAKDIQPGDIVSISHGGRVLYRAG